LGKRGVETKPDGDGKTKSGSFNSRKIRERISEGGTGMILAMKPMNLLEDDTTRGVFEAVARPRTILIRDLKSSFPDIDLNHSITLLKNANLIKEQPAVINDFSTLYVTASGLNVAQAMRQPSLRRTLSESL
jgi:hypothetical protein